MSTPLGPTPLSTDAIVTFNHRDFLTATVLFGLPLLTPEKLCFGRKKRHEKE